MSKPFKNLPRDESTPAERIASAIANPEVAAIAGRPVRVIAPAKRSKPRRSHGDAFEVCMPESVGRSVRKMAFDDRVPYRVIFLRGLAALGMQVPEEELVDARGR